ncbi:phosphopantetheine-binding protein [Hydromonas duriensis]|uniref:Acyl carrier protein n=1 Tax=Hydromonas duriensis TaxID=1527608 RepID=A0A4R6Y729_9BURK|nr:phosphopantetheine-binding protein [Hydromonas duriensis]TDR30746.1 acyl carrier protein [Hydromonas duriensis]
MNDLEFELKKFIIDTLMLEDIAPEEINSSAPLFVEGLGLDSIDALELGVALQKKYGLQISANAAENSQYFSSIQSLAKMVSENRTIN